MNIKWPYFFGVMLLGLLASDLYGAEMSGTLQSGRPIVWNGVAQGGNEWAPAAWDISMRLPPAHKIIAGGPQSSALKNITLTSENGENVTFGVRVVGMEYRLPEEGQVTDLSVGAVTQVQGTSVVVNGEGVGSKIVDFGSATQTPFTHYRPLINVGDVNWTSLFSGKTTGLFQGHVPVTVVYEYYRENIRIRHTLTFPMELSIAYNANTVTRVEVSGDNEMKAHYYGSPERLVAGETAYQVRVIGTVPNGVWIGLRNSTAGDGRFYLEKQGSVAEGAALSIPFGVRCDGCTQNSEFINMQGEPLINMVNRAKAPQEMTLRVSFRDAKLADLEDATYKGAFTLVFEAVL